MVEPRRAEDEFAQPVDGIFAITLAEMDQVFSDLGTRVREFAFDDRCHQIGAYGPVQGSFCQLKFDCGAQHALLEVGTCKRVRAVKEGQHDVVAGVKVLTVHVRSVAKRRQLI